MLITALDAAAAMAGTLVAELTTLFQPLPADLAVPVAIIVFTAAIRLVLLPISVVRFRIAHDQGVLAARIARLRQQFARQPGRLRLELAGPLRRQRRGAVLGLLPMLVQLPFFVALYRLFATATIAGHANGLLAQTLFGTPLGHQLLANLLQVGLFHPYSLVFAGLFVLLGLVAYAASRLADRAAASATLTGVTGPGASAVPAAQLRRIGRLLPYGTVVVAAFVPLAAGLYLLTTTAWSAGERWAEQALRRRSGLTA